MKFRGVTASPERRGRSCSPPCLHIFAERISHPSRCNLIPRPAECTLQCGTNIPLLLAALPLCRCLTSSSLLLHPLCFHSSQKAVRIMIRPRMGPEKGVGHIYTGPRSRPVNRFTRYPLRPRCYTLASTAIQISLHRLRHAVLVHPSSFSQCRCCFRQPAYWPVRPKYMRCR